MPFPNEHSARQYPPSKYEDVRREDDALGDGIHVIWGVLTNNKTEIASIRFDADQYTPAEAVAWLKTHDFKNDLIKATKASLMLRTVTAAAVIAISSPTVQDGTSRQRFKKELIRVGEYVSAKGHEIPVSAELLQHWVKTFHEMDGAGITVPVPAGHSTDARDTMGKVVEVFVEGDSLYGILEMVGDDGIATAIRNDVSVFSPPEWRGGDGQVYLRPILHVALTPYPVVPGLKGFETIAASLMEPDMFDWNKIRKVFAIDDKIEITDESAEEVLLSAAKAHTDNITELGKKITSLEKALADQKSAGAKDPPAKKKELDPLLASLVAENRRMKIDQLTKESAIAPVVAEELHELFAQGDKLELSLASDNTFFDALMAALQKNVALLKTAQEKTGPQLLELSHPTKDDAAETQKGLLENADKMAKDAQTQRTW